jgi:chemotaxis protein MotB
MDGERACPAAPVPAEPRAQPTRCLPRIRKPRVGVGDGRIAWLPNVIAAAAAQPKRAAIIITARKSDYDALQARNQQLESQLTASQQQVSRLLGAVKYVANSDLLLASGSWQMRTQGQQVIVGFAKKLAPTQQHHLLVSGYTDNAPIGPALQRQGITSNQDLSQRRAVDPTLISAHGYGEADPVASNNTPAGRAQNRRVGLSLAP